MLTCWNYYNLNVQFSHGLGKEVGKACCHGSFPVNPVYFMHLEFPVFLMQVLSLRLPIYFWGSDSASSMLAYHTVHSLIPRPTQAGFGGTYLLAFER